MGRLTAPASCCFRESPEVSRVPGRFGAGFGRIRTYLTQMPGTEFTVSLVEYNNPGDGDQGAKQFFPLKGGSLHPE